MRKAEILWALKSVSSHFSFKSCEDVSPLFKAMFCDSNIATNFNCGRTKQAYMITFGIAPFFPEILVDDVRHCDMYTVIFDEAFNSIPTMFCQQRKSQLVMVLEKLWMLRLYQRFKSLNFKVHA